MVAIEDETILLYHHNASLAENWIQSQSDWMAHHFKIGINGANKYLYRHNIPSS